MATAAVSGPTPAQATPRKTLPWATVVVAVAAGTLSFLPGARAAAEFERERILAGELWRLWTAHFVHFGGSHVGWNLAAIVPAGIWVERLVPGRTRLLYLLAPGIIGVALLALDARLQIYAGLSGVATGVLALLAFTQLARVEPAARRWWWGGLGLLAAKIVLETARRQPVFAHFAAAEIQPVPLAHLMGLACAAVVHGWCRPAPSA